MKEEVILQVAAKTSVGRIRELNEDNFIVTNNISGTDWFLPAEAYTNGPTGTVMVVADGMGGTNAGEVASQIAIDGVRKYFNALSSSPLKTGRTGAILKDSILYAHKAIVNHAGAHRETEGMGTTLVLCWILGGRAYVGWSGDSRCYVWHPDRGLRQLSKDHSYVQSLVDDGKITEAEAFDHPQSNIVLQSLGDGTVSPEPDVTGMRIEKDDMLLVCSDGLSGMLKDEEIEEALRMTQGDVGTATSLLIDRANEAGGADNITVILARVIENTMPPEEAADSDEEGEDTERGQKKRGRGRLLGIIGLAVIAIGLAAYSYIHSLHGAGPAQPRVKQDSSGVIRPHAKPDKAPSGVPDKQTPKDDGTGDPSAAKGGASPGAPIPGVGKTPDTANKDSLKQKPKPKNSRSI